MKYLSVFHSNSITILYQETNKFISSRIFPKTSDYVADYHSVEGKPQKECQTLFMDIVLLLMFIFSVVFVRF